MAMEFLKAMFAGVGICFFILLVLSPMCLVLYISVVNKATEEFSGVPYVTTLLYCLLWVWYCLPFVNPHTTVLAYFFGTAAVFELAYVIIFVIYAPKKEKVKLLVLMALLLGVLCTVALVYQFALHDGTARDLCFGIALTFYSILMFGSPLIVLGTVVKTKSVYYMPFSLSVFLYAFNWFMYSLLMRSAIFSVAYGIGSALGALQLVLYYKYRDVKGGYFVFRNIQGGGAVDPPAIEVVRVEMVSQ